MSTASDILHMIASRFDGNTYRAQYIEQAELCVSSTYFGPNRSRAVALLAAHMMSTDESANSAEGGSMGPVSSKSEGDLSVSYGKVSSGSSDDADLISTPYGQQFVSLRRRSGTGIRVTGIPFVSGSF